MVREATNFCVQFNIPSFGWHDVEYLILSYGVTLIKVALQPENKITLPIMDSYPPYFNILDTDLRPLFAAVYIAKNGSFTKPRLYTSRSEMFIVLES